MREGPQAQLLLAYGPEPGQAMGLDDQEPDDQGAEHHELGMRHGGGGNLNTDQAAQQRQKLVQKIGRITINAAPKKLPMMEPMPPMMTMKSNWKERSTEKAAGSQEPR